MAEVPKQHTGGPDDKNHGTTTGFELESGEVDLARIEKVYRKLDLRIIPGLSEGSTVLPVY
jgi:hypothetical protein